jgi:TolA-binding protein
VFFSYATADTVLSDELINEGGSTDEPDFIEEEAQAPLKQEINELEQRIEELEKKHAELVRDQ